MAIWDWDVRANQVEWSHNFPAIHGRASDELHGTLEDLLQDVDAGDRQRVEEAISESLQSGDFYQCEYRLAGEAPPRWVEGKGRVFRDDNGNPVRTAGICMDVTPRRQAEDRLRLLADAGTLISRSLDYEQTLDDVAKLIVPSLADCCIIDTLGEDGTLTPVTIAHSDPQKVQLVQELRRRYPPARNSEIGLYRVTATGEPALYPCITHELLEQIAQDEEHLQILRTLELHSTAMVPLFARGQTIGALTLVSARPERRFGPDDLPFLEEFARSCAQAIDNSRLYRAAQDEVMARQEVQQKLVHANLELSRKNQDLEQMVYTVSHDLKSPLVTIEGFTGILCEDLDAGKIEQCHDAADRIKRAAHRMSELIDDLLELSRVGRLAIEPQQVDLTDLVCELKEELSERLRHVHATLEVQPDMPSIRADRRRLTQVFQNLLTNAIDYGCRGAAPRIEVGAAEADGEVRFFVRDHGPGIPPEHHQRIFGLFHRLDADGEGTGVGLAIVSRIVDAHQGRVWVESSPGHGTTFWLGFPTSLTQSRTPSATLQMDPS